MCNICTLQQVEKKYNYAIIHFLHLDPKGKKKKIPWRCQALAYDMISIKWTCLQLHAELKRQHRDLIQPQSSMGQIIWWNIRHNHLFKKLVQKIISGWTILLVEKIFSKAKAYLQKINEFQMESKATQDKEFQKINEFQWITKDNVYCNGKYLYCTYSS